MIVIGGETQWADSNCGTVSAPGADGDTLGCVALGIAWLTYSVYLLDGGPGVGTPARSLSSSKHHFQVHSLWEPVGNCTTSCMLLGHALQHVWTPVGNGTYNGIHHELHFMHTDKFTAHRAFPGVIKPGEDNSTLTPRQWVSIHGQLVNTGGVSPHTYLYNLRSQQLNYAATINEYPSPDHEAAPEWMGQSVEESVALSNNSGFCFTLIHGGAVVDSSVLGLSQTGSEWGSDWNSAGDIEDALANCAADNLDGNHIGNGVLVCGHNLTRIDPSLEDDPDGTSDPTGLKARSLNKRTGSSENYAIRNMAQVAAGADPVTIINWQSAPYINGANGQNLQAATGDDHAYTLANPGICTDASIRDDAELDGPNAVAVDAEHIFERNTVPAIFEFAQTLSMDLQDGNGPITPAGLVPIPFTIIENFAAVDYRLWPNVPADGPFGNLFDDLADALGSTSNPDVMTNLEHLLNLVKTRVWRALDVTSNDVWGPLAATPTTSNTQDALDLMRSVSNFCAGTSTSSKAQRLIQTSVCRALPCSTISTTAQYRAKWS